MYKINTNYVTTIDKERKAIYLAKDKERIKVETINAYGSKFKTEDDLLEAISNKYGKYHHHPLTGPIMLENSREGDTLKIEIESIDLKEMGQSLSRSAGVEPIVESTKKARAPVIGKLNGNLIKYKYNFLLKKIPMIGIIATNSKDNVIKTGHAKKVNGGNLDLPIISEGNCVYLPVETLGGGLYLGDVHALEGYGELSGISLEASAEIDLILENIKGEALKNIIVMGCEPIFKAEGIGIIGVGDKENLEEAIKDAYSGTIMVLNRIFPDVEEGMIKNLISLIGQNLNGQALAKTSESTSMIFIKKDDIENLLGRKIDFIELEEMIFNKNKKYGGNVNDTNKYLRK